MATVGALACHFALFLVVFPGIGDTVVIEEPPVLLFPTAYVPPPPPPEIEVPVRVVADAPRVPIPDPTPRDPEPLVAHFEVYRFDPRIPVSADFAVDLPAVPPPAPDRVRAGLDVERPRLLEKTVPVYPELAVRARMECTVVLEAVIGRTGDVIAASTLRGCGFGIDESALAAVRRWRYTPTMVNGRPVEVVATVTVHFELR